jgi:hypothetical protein
MKGCETKFFVAQISQSAVSPISNRQGAAMPAGSGLAGGLRIGNPRYGRMQFLRCKPKIFVSHPK